MRLIRLASALSTLVLVVALAPVAAARTPVDPTTLTPPLKPFRSCWQEGPYVRCDTSDVSTFAYEPLIDAPCGTVYETSVVDSHATRWYRDGLIIRRQVQEHFDGTWTLDPSGAGRSVAIRSDVSWDELFATPGDIESGILSTHGSDVLIPALAREVHEAGTDLADGTHRGRLVSSDEDFADLCALLT